MSKIKELLSDKQIELVLEVIQNAADAVMEIYESGDFGLDRKDNNSPVTLADIKSHEILIDGLPKVNQEYVVISEEGDEEPTGDTYWLIDPLDGTSDFLKQNGEFAVMVALMHNQEPVFGIVNAPARKQLFAGGKLLGESYKIEKGQKKTIQAVKSVSRPTKVVASRSHRHPKTDEYLKSLGDYELLSIGSGLKFCYVADGSIDIYVRFQGTMEWDTAAPQAILDTAGATINWEDKNFTYGKIPRLNTGFICKSNAL